MTADKTSPRPCAIAVQVTPDGNTYERCDTCGKTGVIFDCPNADAPALWVRRTRLADGRWAPGDVQLAMPEDRRAYLRYVPAHAASALVEGLCELLMSVEAQGGPREAYQEQLCVARDKARDLISKVGAL